MTWFRVDDKFWGHPKQTALPAGAVALWVRAGSWSADQLTDGRVPEHMVLMLGAKRRDAQQLVTAGLWAVVDGGYQFHEWTEWQPTREEVHAKRAEEAERKRKWREKRAADKAAAEASVPDVSQWDNSVASGGTDAGVPDLSRSSRPDPTRPSLPTEEREGRQGGSLTYPTRKSAPPPSTRITVATTPTTRCPRGVVAARSRRRSTPGPPRSSSSHPPPPSASCT